MSPQFEQFLFMYGESNIKIFPTVSYTKDTEDAKLIWATRTQVGVVFPDGTTDIISMKKVNDHYSLDFMLFRDLGKSMYINSMLITDIIGVEPRSKIVPLMEIVKYIIRASNDYTLQDVFHENIDEYFESAHIQFHEGDDEIVSEYFTIASDYFIITCYKQNYEIDIQVLNGHDIIIKNENIAEYLRLLILFGVNIFTDYE